MRPSVPRAAQLAAVTLTLAIVGWLSLAPQPQVASPVAPVLFTGSAVVAGAVLNFCFYVPLGAALGLLPIRLAAAISAGASISLLMEAAQLVIPGRVSSLLDIATNTGGATAGYLAVRSWRALVAPPDTSRGRIAAAAGVLFLGVTGLTGYLMAPDYPTGTYVAQWLPDLGGHDQPYEGALRLVEIGQHPVPRGAVEPSADVQAALVEGAPIRILGTASAPPPSLSLLFQLLLRPRQPLVSIGVDGADVTVVLRRRATRWGLSQPTSYADGLMEGIGPGSDFTLVLWRDGTQHCLSVNHRQDCGLALTLGRGWSLLRDPPAGSRDVSLLLSFGWLCALSFPLGLWLPSRYRSVASLTPMLIGALGVPVFFGLPATSVLEWMALLTGLAAGVAAQRATRLAASDSTPLLSVHGE